MKAPNNCRNRSKGSPLGGDSLPKSGKHPNTIFSHLQPARVVRSGASKFLKPFTYVKGKGFQKFGSVGLERGLPPRNRRVPYVGYFVEIISNGNYGDRA